MFHCQSALPITVPQTTTNNILQFLSLAPRPPTQHVINIKIIFFTDNSKIYLFDEGHTPHTEPID